MCGWLRLPQPRSLRHEIAADEMYIEQVAVEGAARGRGGRGRCARGRARVGVGVCVWVGVCVCVPALAGLMICDAGDQQASASIASSVTLGGTLRYLPKPLAS